MSDKHSSQTPEITRRATFKLATAVAAFGAALGMRATSARAEGKVEIKGQSERKGEHIAKGVLTSRDGKSEGRSTIKQEGSGYIKLKK